MLRDDVRNRSEYSKAKFATEQVDFPHSFAIITAYNPEGVEHTIVENKSFNAFLKEEISNRFDAHTHFFKITRHSECSSHKVPGWGIECSVDEAIELGTLFKQEAIFWISEERLSLVDVKTHQKEYIGIFNRLSFIKKSLFSMSSVMQEELAELIVSEEPTGAKYTDYDPSNLSESKRTESVNSPRFYLQMLAEWSNDNRSGMNYVLSDLEHDQHLNLYKLDAEWCVESPLEDDSPEAVWQAILDFLLLGLGKMDWELATANRDKFIMKLKSIDLESLFQVKHLRFANCNEIKQKVELFSELAFTAQPSIAELPYSSAEGWAQSVF